MGRQGRITILARAPVDTKGAQLPGDLPATKTESHDVSRR